MVIDSEITLRMENWRGGDWAETQNGAHVMRRKGCAMQNKGIDHFTVVCLVAWPLNESEAGVDLVLIETSLLFICN